MKIHDMLLVIFCSEISKMSSKSAYDELGFVEDQIAQSDFASVEYTRTASPAPATQAAGSQSLSHNDMDKLEGDLLTSCHDGYDTNDAVTVDNPSFDDRSAASHSTNGSNPTSPEPSCYNDNVNNVPVIVESHGMKPDGGGDCDSDVVPYSPQDGDDLQFPYEDTDGVYGSSYEITGDGVSDLGVVDAGNYDVATATPRLGPSDESTVAAKTSVHGTSPDLHDVNVGSPVGPADASSSGMLVFLNLLFLRYLFISSIFKNETRTSLLVGEGRGGCG